MKFYWADAQKDTLVHPIKLISRSGLFARELSSASTLLDGSNASFAPRVLDLEDGARPVRRPPISRTVPILWNTKYVEFLETLLSVSYFYILIV